MRGLEHEHECVSSIVHRLHLRNDHISATGAYLLVLFQKGDHALARHNVRPAVDPEKALGQLKEDKGLVFGKDWIPLLGLISIDCFIFIYALIFLVLIAVLAHVVLQQVDHLVLDTLRVEAHIIGEQLEESGAYLITLTPEVRHML